MLAGQYSSKMFYSLFSYGGMLNVFIAGENGCIIRYMIVKSDIAATSYITLVPNTREITTEALRIENIFGAAKIGGQWRRNSTGFFSFLIDHFLFHSYSYGEPVPYRFSNDAYVAKLMVPLRTVADTIKSMSFYSEPAKKFTGNMTPHSAQQHWLYN